jgi:hypothetical protein
VPRQASPSREIARSHTPDVPRAMAAAAASSDVPALLPSPSALFNGRSAPLPSMPGPGSASEMPHSALPLLRGAERRPGSA